MADGPRSLTPALERGRLVALALEGAWREAPPPWDVTPAGLATAAPLLLATGAGALGWWRLRRTAPTEAALPLHQAYRRHALENAVHEQQIREALPLLRAAGIEPLLAKGWAAARLYPEPGLRPYGDIDLFVHPDQHAAALCALRRPGHPPLPVDLHRGFAELDDFEAAGILARSVVVSQGGLAVRVPGPEDHLRLLGLHALRHGVSRALWLCDVAAALESRPEGFDWDRLLGGAPRRAQAVVAALGLAHALLGARIAETPVAERLLRLPRWLVPAVLRQWGVGSAWREPMGSFLRRPRGALREVLRHWPNPIEGTMGVGGPFNEWPRLPFQLAHVLVRAAAFGRALRRGSGAARQS